METSNADKCSPPAYAVTSKPGEYQPVPTADINAQYPSISRSHVSHPGGTQNAAAEALFSGPRPNNYLGLTLFTLFCCFCWPAVFCSIIAIIYSMQVDFAWEVGYQNGAQKSAKNAKNWGIAACITGVVTLVVIGTIYGVVYALQYNALTHNY